MTNSIEDSADSYYDKALSLQKAGHFKEAFVQLRLCLEVEPRHSEARLMLGEEYLLRPEELGISDEEGETAAREAFEYLLNDNPKKTEAWAGLALLLLYQDNHTGAIEAANEGFKVISADTSWVMASPEVFMNVAESLYDVKIRAYLEAGEKECAAAQLQEGLVFCPDSEFLSRHLDGRMKD